MPGCVCLSVGVCTCRAGQQQCVTGGGHFVGLGICGSDRHHHHPPAPPRHTSTHQQDAAAFRQWPGAATCPFCVPLSVFPFLPFLSSPFPPFRFPLSCLSVFPFSAQLTCIKLMTFVCSFAQHAIPLRLLPFLILGFAWDACAAVQVLQ